MGQNDFFSNEKSVTVAAATDVKIEFVGADGSSQVLKEKTPLKAGEILDATRLSKAALVAFYEQQIARAGCGNCPVIKGNGHGLWDRLLGFVAFRVRIAVHDDVAEEVQQLGRAVAARREIEQLRRGVEHRRCCLAAAEFLVLNDVFEERYVGLHAADAKF